MLVLETICYILRLLKWGNSNETEAKANDTNQAIIFTRAAPLSKRTAKLCLRDALRVDTDELLSVKHLAQRKDHAEVFKLPARSKVESNVELKSAPHTQHAFR